MVATPIADKRDKRMQTSKFSGFYRTPRIGASTQRSRSQYKNVSPPGAIGHVQPSGMIGG
jgi:hypothetical protein